MLTISKVEKAFAGRVLFQDASLQVNAGDRIGLVGKNGAGKSTLFSLILGDASPDEGSVSVQRNATLGYLPQETASAGDETVLELATAISPEFLALRKLLAAHERGEVPDSDDYYDALARFDELGGWQLEPKAKRILNGLAFREADFERPVRDLSGGWIMRAHLARLLVSEPDLLMLDEPTNHLDLHSLIWFQEYLQSYPGAILMISHDRAFLNELVNQIVEIRHSRLQRYQGNYEDYLRERAAREEQQIAAYKNQRREIEQLQRFADRFRAKASKASQAQSKLKQIDRMEKIEAPEADEKVIHFKFPQPQRSGHRAITLAHVRHAYGTNVVYDDLNFEAERGQRTVLVGPNGAGKSTLLKLLAGAMDVQGGERVVGHNVRVGYFAQHRIELAASKRTVLEEVSDLPQAPSEQTIRTMLGAFLFRGDDVFKPVAILSGGEKSRLALVKLLLDPPNLLLMDEPTTHLDIPSCDALLVALKQFEGTLIFISHDVYFIREIATSVVQVQAGSLAFFPGGYDYYLGKTKAVSERSGLTQGQPMLPAAVAKPERSGSPRKSRDQRREEARERQIRAGARKEKEKRVHDLEAEIVALESRRSLITTELEQPETYEKSGAAMTLNRELAGIEEALERLNAEWAKAGEELAEAQAAAV